MLLAVGVKVAVIVRVGVAVLDGVLLGIGVFVAVDWGIVAVAVTVTPLGGHTIAGNPANAETVFP